MNNWLEEQEMTNNLEEAIFLLKDGRMVSGQFDMGMRGLDHNCIISLAPEELPHTEKWEYIHNKYNIVRLVPETKTALINKGQALSVNQLALLSYEYEIEEY